MKIIITGSNGFLGSRAASFLEKGHQVICLSHQQVNFGNKEQVSRVIAEKRPDVLFHCGAISNVGTCEKNQELSEKIVNGR